MRTALLASASAALLTLLLWTQPQRAEAILQCSYCEIYLRSCCLNPFGCGVVNVPAIAQSAKMAHEKVRMVENLSSEITRMRDPVAYLGIQDLIDYWTTIEINMRRTRNPCKKREHEKATKDLIEAIPVVAKNQVQAAELNRELFENALRNSVARQAHIHQFLEMLTVFSEQMDKKLSRAKGTRDYLGAASGYLLLESAYVAIITSASAIQLDLEASAELSIDPKIIKAAAK